MTTGAKELTTVKNAMNGFELQTKIRVIIQEVLSATVRKLSIFNQKIDKFENYFISFKDKFDSSEGNRFKMSQAIQKIQDTNHKIKQEMNMQSIKMNEDMEKSQNVQRQYRNELLDFQKSLKQVLRQNESTNSELSKTKSKFLEYSQTMTTLKQQVSWKISKYLEETAQQHTQVKLYAENLKNQYYKINLSVDKQKEKYDKIILSFEEDKNFKEEVYGITTQLQKNMIQNAKKVKNFKASMDDVELSLLSKMKNSDTKFENKFVELEKNNRKLLASLQKIDTFNAIIDNLKTDNEENSIKMQVKIQQSYRNGRDDLNEEIVKINKEFLRLQRDTDKKIKSQEQKKEKFENYFTQKLQFLKAEILSQMSTKTTQYLQQKSQNQNKMASSTANQLEEKINKIKIQSSKKIVQVQNKLKEKISIVKTSLQEYKEEVNETIVEKIQNMGPVSSSSGQNSNVSNNQLKKIQQNISGLSHRTFQTEKAISELNNYNGQFKNKYDKDLLVLEEKLNSKVQKVMFLVTKMRGDSIIRNQFNEKQIRQLRKQNQDTKQNIVTLWKIQPSMGQCINLILSLIFDAEYQHSKIIQDNLPLLNKDIEKFSTVCQGVLYQFKEKRKQGFINYRHNEIKKTDIVKATFQGYIEMWQDIFENDLKSKQNFIPKTFYKKAVEKILKSKNNDNFGDLQATQSVQININKSQKKIDSSSSNQLLNESQSDMTASFHIRKKKTIGLKERQEAFSLSHKIIKE